MDTWRQVFAINENKFPDDFLFGTATASYQVEGAWNTNGKGENIWDRYTHQYPDKILDKSNGDVACDSYNKLEEDVRLLKNMNVDFYRFSVSWSRILPKGFAYQVNADGIRYYNNLIDLLISNGITPMVTMFHWDTPQNLEYFGGFTNSLIVNWFEEYARILFDNFGDRVKFWITFNEPKQTCAEGYGIGTKAPGYKLFGIADYMCIHNVLKSHARVYHLYNNTYKETQQGKIGITNDAVWSEPKTQSVEDVEAAERGLLFTFGLYTDPIYHYNGDYPQVVKEFVSARSKLEGFSYSRLPKFTPEEITYIKGTYDFFGLNHYTTTLVNNVDPFPIGDPSQIKDARIRTSFSPSWPKTASSWFKVVPWGFTKVLKWIKNRYGDIDIYVTENGYSDHECLNDQERINYYKQYLSALLDAIYDHKVNVKGYAAWSFLDNFEWNDGYVNRFGLYHVNFSDPQRTRTPKASLYYFKNIIKNRKLIKL
ncbi:hypothetical protein RN001_000124 [Aquatica leii]|uniref:Beta-glucosidase n=1 Tax=Aquatica leii TaxID=1421715 RepID=A0AAN7PEX2_9COLE|nr:hypothetical protein RN001_000124 [Aquatica leii]